MADVDLILQGMRDLRGGVRGLSGDISEIQQSQRINEERQRKLDAEKVRQERLGQMSQQVTGLIEASQAPEFTREEFVKQADPLIRGAIESGDATALQAIQDVRNVLEKREKENLERIRAGVETTKETRRGKEAADTAARESRKEIRDIKQQYDKNDTTEKTNILRSTYKAISDKAEAKPSAARDMAIIFNYMKLLDPGSVVREKEFQTAQEAKSFFTRKVSQNEDGEFITSSGTVLPSFLVQAFQKMDPDQRGSFLLPDQLEDFVSSAEGSFRSQLDVQKAIDDRTLTEVDEVKGDRKKVIPRLAAEDLAELDAKKQAKSKKKDLDGAGKDKSSVSAGNSSLKVIDTATADQIRSLPENQAKFKAGLDKLNTSRAAKGLPALSPVQAEVMLWEKLGYQVVPTAGGE